jgi:hypothetical protein
MTVRLRYLAVALAVVAGQGHGAPPLPPAEGDALHRALLGAWCNSHDGGRTCWAYDRFFADGRFHACGRHDDERRPFSGTGIVDVKGRTMCYRVTQASPNFWLEPGERYCTQIVAIDRRTHRYRDLDTGAEFTLHRRAPSGVKCPQGAAP